MRENTTYLLAYKEVRSYFKLHCDKQKYLHNRKVLDDLVSSSVYPKSFWNKLKRLTDSRNRGGNTISKAQWQEHFEKLSKSNNIGNSEINIFIEDDHDEIEYDIT